MLTVEDRPLLLDSVDGFLAHYGWAAAWAVEHGVFLFNGVPTHHFFFHLARQGVYLNPRFSWTYGCEYFVGKIAVAAARCARGTKIQNVSASLVGRYRAALHLQLAGL